MSNKTISRQKINDKNRAPTAKKIYQQREIEIKALIQKLQTKLKKHKQGFKNSPNNWSYAGDLAYVSQLLKDATNFISSEKY